MENRQFEAMLAVAQERLAQHAPEEIAEVMVFLASDSARGVNGNIMFVDGGTDALLNSEKVY